MSDALPDDALAAIDFAAYEGLQSAGIGDLPVLAGIPKWQRRAACRAVEMDRFFSGATDDVLAALEVCDGCPVVEECLRFALQHGEVGVWGATTDQQRKAIHRGDPVPARPERRKVAAEATHDSRCGSSAGYARHWRRGEDACDACLEAQRVKSAEANARRRAAAA